MIELVESVLFNVHVFDFLFADDVPLVEHLDRKVLPVGQVDCSYYLLSFV